MMWISASLVMALPVVGQESSAGIPLPSEQKTQTEACGVLVLRAREVERLLRSVSDRESADAVAEQVSEHLAEMKKGFEHLEKLPLSNEEEARAVAMEMRSLAHVMQGMMPVLQVLREVNAYGSEKLINVFYMYKLLPGSAAPEPVAPSDVWFQV